MLIQILIPTYNRSDFLARNLDLLLREIVESGLANVYELVISDNASTDQTPDIVAQAAVRYQQAGVGLKSFRNTENLGLEGNAVQILSYADRDYVLWLGDDDFLPVGFLDYALACIQNRQVGWLMSGATAEFSDGTQADTYGLDYEEKYFAPGYEAIWSVSNYGHKMSGLLLRRAGMLESYLAKPQWRNIYPFIYFLAYNQIRFPGIFAPGKKVLVNTYNKKDFDYNSVGLIDEVYKSYNYLIDVFGLDKVIDLLIRFSVMHSYRFSFKSGPTLLWKQWKFVYARYEFGAQLKWPLFRMLAKEYLSQLLFRKK
jgi:abequosyltransferase